MTHYYDKDKKMPMIKHGFTHADDVPATEFLEWVNNEHPQLNAYDDVMMDVDLITMEGAEFVIALTEGEVVRCYPPQLRLLQIDGKHVIRIEPMENYVAFNAHAIPAMFDYLLENYKDLGFHPTKTPKTIQLLRDISIHLLRPMEADCPNEKMQEAVQEILWHVNNHVKPGDYMVLRVKNDDLIYLVRVLNFNANTNAFIVETITASEDDVFPTLDVYYSDTNIQILKYFGVERWAYPDAESALNAAHVYFESTLAEKLEKPE